MQPDAFQRLVTRQYVEDGLASRFLWTWPPDRPGGWVDERPDKPTLSVEYASAYTRLSAVRLNIAPDGKIQPFFVGLSRSAQALAKTWVNALRDRVAAAPDPAIRAALAKLKGIAFRMALLFHLTDWAGQGAECDFDAISAGTLARAIVVTDWFAGEADRVYGMLAESGDDRDRRRLVEWIEGRGRAVTVRDLTHGLHRYRGATDAARAALDDLAERGIGRWEHPAPGPNGGRPSKRFRLATSVTITETPHAASANGSIGDGDAGNGADEWSEL